MIYIMGYAYVIAKIEGRTTRIPVTVPEHHFSDTIVSHNKRILDLISDRMRGMRITEWKIEEGTDASIQDAQAFDAIRKSRQSIGQSTEIKDLLSPRFKNRKRNKYAQFSKIK